MNARPFKRVLVANRGEIAVRIIRGCHEEGVEAIAVYSEVDADALHVRMADDAVCIGAAPSTESYLRTDAVIQAAKTSGCDAVHPGYGFLSENASFAQRVVGYLAEGGHVGEQTGSVLEVGAGLGHFAAGVLETLRDEHPDVYAGLSYTILDLSPALRGAQKKELESRGVADKVTWLEGNAETYDLGAAAWDLVLCNEVIGDFTTIKLNANDADHPLITKYELPIQDAPDDLYLNVGALEFVSRIADALKEGGSAFLTEYGELNRYPVASTQLDHIEFSIQFGHICHVGRQCGLEVDYQYLQKILQLDTDKNTLATTRSYFNALQAMLATFGVDLDKLAYSDEALSELIAGKVELEHIGDIRFQMADERCMGLAPHEFKAVVLRKAPSAA